MSKCLATDSGLHSFINSRDVHENDRIVQLYMTCLACGERRAIGIAGDLLIRQNSKWVKLEPPEASTEDKEQSDE